ncbi:hypothetical protein TruAng_004906 [Truncatella angustata]|nr:hypothetical protein TruAng_004906 [Truncatella angustata]
MRFRSLLILAGISKAALIDNGTVVTLNGIAYYVGGVSVGQLGKIWSGSPALEPTTVHGLGLFPMTIIDTFNTTIQSDELVNIVSEYENDDDVFQSGFLSTIYIRPSTNISGFHVASLSSTLSGFNTTTLISSSPCSEEAFGIKTVSRPIMGDPAKGPYFVSAATGNLYMAYRLYDDDYLAFIQGVITDGVGGFRSLPAVTENVMAKSVAVPSRLYYTVTEDQPLAGLRLGVKDIYHVKGIATSGGNRAYFYTYGTQNITAPSVQRLIDLGAVLVGKMGTVQFANGDSATADWVDLHAPFNPRGDGYQDPSGSSTGPGAGIGAYEWLDLAVGSDTGGSMRGPAGQQGIYGNRPSTGAISMDHVIPLSPVSDTAGIFARSGKLWAKATKAWYPDFLSNHTSYPKSLFYSVSVGDWNSEPASADTAILIDGWISQLEGFLKLNATRTNYTAKWEATHGSAPADLAGMLHSTYGVYITHDQWQLLGQPLFSDYATKHGGRQPYINPGPLSRWRWAQENATDEIYSQALKNITIFKNWWETDGYGGFDTESCSEGLYVYAWGVGLPSYRDEYRSAPHGPPLGFGDSSIPIIAGTPEIVVPIGETSYVSRITGQTEYLPVTMALRMSRGCDFALADLVSDLEDAGVLRPVSAGSRLYR